MGSLAALSSAIEARDPYARGHSSRVTVFAQAMARGLRLDKERISVLRLGALLHDVGRVAELTAGPTFRQTDEGRLLGHVHLGLRLVEERAAALDTAARAGGRTIAVRHNLS